MQRKSISDWNCQTLTYLKVQRSSVKTSFAKSSHLDFNSKTNVSVEIIYGKYTQTTSSKSKIIQKNHNQPQRQIKNKITSKTKSIDATNSCFPQRKKKKFVLTRARANG